MATQEKVLIATGSEAELIVSRVTLIRDIAGQAISGDMNVREALGRIRVLATGLGVQLGTPDLMTTTDIIAAEYGGPVGPTLLRPLVSSVRVEHGPVHDVVHAWNRGGKAGTLTVDSGDGDRIAARLLPEGETS